jgi:hypothetical protein
MAILRTMDDSFLSFDTVPMSVGKELKVPGSAARWRRLDDLPIS